MSSDTHGLQKLLHVIPDVTPAAIFDGVAGVRAGIYGKQIPDSSFANDFFQEIKASLTSGMTEHSYE